MQSRITIEDKPDMIRPVCVSFLYLMLVT